MISSFLNSLCLCFGLSEYGKPPTLLKPRPGIEIKRIKENKIVIETELNDDSVNIILKMFTPAEILAAIKEKKSFKIDLTTVITGVTVA